MGLAKVLLGRKETGIAKCVRADSLGLARRRLAAKTLNEGLEEDSEVVVAQAGGEAELTKQKPVDVGDQDGSDNKPLSTMSLQHRDSLRIHRQRFNERASLDLSNLRQNKASLQGSASCISGAPPSFPAPREGLDTVAVGEELQGERTSCRTNGPRHVRFRRASDGEYLASTRAHTKGHEGGFPNALKAVQLKAERLFRRLTANFSEVRDAASPKV